LVYRKTKQMPRLGSYWSTSEDSSSFSYFSDAAENNLCFLGLSLFFQRAKVLARN
jgi:hypothetical protein